MPSSLYSVWRNLRVAITLFAVVLVSPAFSQVSIPLPAHSHNDYDRPRALFSALQLRFASVEADVYLINDELRVGHEQQDLMRGRTLRNLYLEPLRLLVMRGAGQVYPETTTPLILVIDIKSEAEATYRQLERALAPYESFLTRFTEDGIEPGAVTVVISGNSPRELMASQPERFMALDGRLADLTGGSFDADFMPMVSVDWQTVFDWRGSDSMPAAQLEQLSTLVQLARDNDVHLRFWNAPDIPPVWGVLYESGVPLINTDRIDALSEFLLSAP